MRVLIFVNGYFKTTPFIRRSLTDADYIIAVNGGTRHALSVDLIPNVIVGDQDSLSPADRERVVNVGTQFIEFPARKDETDLELALHHAVEKRATEVYLFGALGGRIDHALANVLLLSFPEFERLPIRFFAEQQELFLIRQTARIFGNPGDLVSILPIGGAAIGVSNSGLEWSLKQETLPPGSPRGISNVLLDTEASITLQQGRLVCIVTHRSG